MGLAVNNMQDAYATIAALKSRSSQTSDDAFAAFITQFADIVRSKSPKKSLIALFNTANIKKAQYLDDFIRAVVVQAIKPSDTLL